MLACPSNLLTVYKSPPAANDSVAIEWRLVLKADILFYSCGGSHLFKASVAGTKAGHIKDLLSRLAAVSIRQPFQRRLVQGYRYLFSSLLHGLDGNDQSTIDLFYIPPCQHGNIAVPQSGKAAEQECPFGCLVGSRSLDKCKKFFFCEIIPFGLLFGYPLVPTQA